MEVTLSKEFKAKPAKEFQQEVGEKIHKLNEEYKAKFDESMKYWYDNTIAIFPICEELPHYRQLAMMHTNENNLGVDYDYWLYLFNSTITEYRYNDLVTIMATCDRLVMKDWVTTYGTDGVLGMWTTFRKYIHEVENVVNPIIQKHTFDLLDKLLRMQYLSVSGQATSIPKHNPIVAGKKK